MWRCKTCDNMNPDKYDHCYYCGTARPAEEKAMSGMAEMFKHAPEVRKLPPAKLEKEIREVEKEIEMASKEQIPVRVPTKEEATQTKEEAKKEIPVTDLIIRIAVIGITLAILIILGTVTGMANPLLNGMAAGIGFLVMGINWWSERKAPPGEAEAKEEKKPSKFSTLLWAFLFFSLFGVILMGMFVFGGAGLVEFIVKPYFWISVLFGGFIGLSLFSVLRKVKGLSAGDILEKLKKDPKAKKYVADVVGEIERAVMKMMDWIVRAAEFAIPIAIITAIILVAAILTYFFWIQGFAFIVMFFWYLPQFLLTLRILISFRKTIWVIDAIKEMEAKKEK